MIESKNRLNEIINSFPSLVTLTCSTRCWYFAVASKACYAPRLPLLVTYVGGQVCCYFHGMVQCYRQMLRISVMLCSNFFHLVTSSQTALVTQHVCTHLYMCKWTVVLQFSWNGTMLRTDVTHCSYVIW